MFDSMEIGDEAVLTSDYSPDRTYKYVKGTGGKYTLIDDYDDGPVEFDNVKDIAHRAWFDFTDDYNSEDDTYGGREEPANEHLTIHHKSLNNTSNSRKKRMKSKKVTDYDLFGGLGNNDILRSTPQFSSALDDLKVGESFSVGSIHEPGMYDKIKRTGENTYSFKSGNPLGSSSNFESKSRGETARFMSHWYMYNIGEPIDEDDDDSDVYKVSDYTVKKISKKK